MNAMRFAHKLTSGFKCWIWREIVPLWLPAHAVVFYRTRGGLNLGMVAGKRFGRPDQWDPDDIVQGFCAVPLAV
jgi:hypothetical protein